MRFFAAVAGRQSPPVLEEADPWSVYLYLCGSNLETKMGAAGKNIDEILAADLPDGANIVIETGGAGKWRSHDIPSDKLCRYTVKDGKLCEEQRLDSASMGDAQTLSDFIGYCLENYPAKRTALILWDHGGGASGEVCFDENYGMDCLTPAELKKALGSQEAHFDVIGFDACLMATNETAALMHEYADYMLASEEISPSGGGLWRARSKPFGGEDGGRDVQSGGGWVHTKVRKLQRGRAGDAVFVRPRKV